ncbi:hypothetical protein RRG08_011163 [Elysia crispata]|uniref:Uncharacterized protein n=1 Tax=Elysia crispata TaxID=231223 RepID=A0AAE1A153_9GAST|nr:hypothetical protein RRG08_011163 [Elysia crispata]
MADLWVWLSLCKLERLPDIQHLKPLVTYADFLRINTAPPKIDLDRQGADFSRSSDRSGADFFWIFDLTWSRFVMELRQKGADFSWKSERQGVDFS